MRDENNSKHYFKNMIYLAQQRAFHGVIDRSESATEDQAHYIHYSFIMAADFSKIIAGCIEPYGALGPGRYFNVVGEEVTIQKEYLQDDMSEE
jgi:hypothetical protein